jgi:hypothetical protein
MSIIKPGPNPDIKLEIWQLLMILGSGERHSGTIRQNDLPFLGYLN